MENQPQTVICYCSSCNRLTNHIIVSSEKVTSPDDGYWWSSTYCIIKCCGCDTISFLTATKEEGVVNYDDEGEIFYPTVYKTYPHKKPFAKPIDYIWPIPTNIANIYKETISALDNECYLLAAAGFRVIVEAICLDIQVEGKQLETKINNLCKKGIITMNDRDRLHSIRFMGNDSVHSIKKPDIQQIKLVLDIVHNMLNGLYVLTEKCKEVLEGPISNYDDFLNLLEEGLKKRNIGEIDILKNLLLPSRRLINEDRSVFENQLKEMIKNGEFTKLALCPPPQHGKNQQYKIVNI